ncbi:hypothetical protein FQN60_007645 [Etheostoma spectabile]|uniref:CCN family member 3 n=1 Tax=Etheostoma spectabile TaxID=54343 RepID=A0A5J5CZV5_9PERO|nr:hypothetical protein FQN60_007645 [Etheostoma spectabile]
MPMVTSPAPEVFQRKLVQALEGLPRVCVIADDVLIKGEGATQEEAEKDHDEKLRRFLTRCRKRNVKLNADKFKLKQKDNHLSDEILGQLMCKENMWEWTDIQEEDVTVFRGDRAGIPDTLRVDITHRIHSSHLGVKGCLRRARECVYWLGMSEEIKTFISKWDICRSGGLNTGHRRWDTYRVKTAKLLMLKAAAARQAVLGHCNMPSQVLNTSPAQRLLSKEDQDPASHKGHFAEAREQSGMALVSWATPTGLVFKWVPPPRLHQSSARRITRVTGTSTTDEHAFGNFSHVLCSPAYNLIAQEGQTCDLGGKIYRSGESFRPSCKHQCVCMNGEIGCVPMCANNVLLPSPDCPYPRRVHIPGRCCEEWLCEQSPPDHHYQSVLAGASQIRPLPSSNPISVFRSLSPHGPQAESPRDNCIVQTTEWSECSATCDMGVSSRVTNDNQRCQLERQSRICMLRPCSSQQHKDIKKGKKCVRTPKAQHGMRFELSGCSSTRLYKPKFCGVCTDNRCCTPHTTITALVEFHCPDGEVFTKNMMFIKTCSCHHDCPQDNDIFLASNTRRMIGDYDNDM